MKPLFSFAVVAILSLSGCSVFKKNCDCPKFSMEASPPVIEANADDTEVVQASGIYL